jgi:hypothetical protein
MSRRPTSGSHGHLLGPLRGDGGTSSKDLPVASASGADINILEGIALGLEASPPLSRSVKLPLGLPGLGAEVALPHSTIISVGPRGQTPALSSESTELP